MVYAPFPERGGGPSFIDSIQAFVQICFNQDKMSCIGAVATHPDDAAEDRRHIPERAMSDFKMFLIQVPGLADLWYFYQPRFDLRSSSNRTGVPRS